jgi:HD-like signal output (HDOD) protein
MKIQEIIHKQDVSVEGVCDILTSEPVMTVHILKIVNSAYYGFRREIDDIKFAVAYLGIHEIYNMVLTLSVMNTLKMDEEQELDRFWNHSVLTALCARYLGRRFEPLLQPERIWIAAMLHDLGKLIFNKFYPLHYSAIVEYINEKGILFSQAESDLTYPKSSLMGSILCERWRLPQIIKDACECHDFKSLNTSGEGARGDFKRLISAANLMAVLTANELSTEVKQELFDSLSRHFRMDEKEFLKMMGEIYDLKLDLAKYRW